jgi:hypothetical protein
VGRFRLLLLLVAVVEVLILQVILAVRVVPVAVVAHNTPMVWVLILTVRLVDLEHQDKVTLVQQEIPMAPVAVVVRVPQQVLELAWVALVLILILLGLPQLV